MATLRQFKEEHQKELDAQFKLKYPEGQFVFQHRESVNFGEVFALYRNTRRNTSYTKYYGIAVTYSNGEIHFENYQNNSFGKCKYFDSLDKLIAFATEKVPDNLLQVFKQKCESNLISK